MKEPQWISAALVEAIHERQLAEHGGQAGLRERSRLISALERAQGLFCHPHSPPDLCALAAAYASGIVKIRPFLEGNTRTAFTTCRVFLKWNNRKMLATTIERYLKMRALSTGDLCEIDFANWLREVTITA